MNLNAFTAQTTLRTRVSTEGTGLHTGATVQVTLRPAPVDAGIVFVRTDLPRVVEIPARAEFVVDTTLNTTLGRNGVRVGTVEHLLAALRGLGVDNVRIEVNGPEIPILDGSAAPFVKLIEQAQIRSQRAARKVAVVRRPIVLQDGEKEVALTPASSFTVQCEVDFRHPLITSQKLSVEVSARSFVRDIASARTFGFSKDIARLRARGLAQGGSLDNAIVVDDFTIQNPDGLRWPDEFVRHKILDAIGDLALVGYPVIGALRAFKTGHALNQKLVQRLCTDPELVEIVTLGAVPEGRAAEGRAEVPAGQLEGSVA